MLTIRYLFITVMGFFLFLGTGFFLNPLQAFPTLLGEKTVQDGAKVTVWYQITPRDTATTSYSDIQQFTQGQHTIPLGIEQRIAGMHPGEARAFSLSPEEGFGPYDETKVQTIPPTELPIEAREGDTIANRAGTSARIIRILPEKAMLDLNHPLAGKQLLVSLQIVTIEDSNVGENTPVTTSCGRSDHPTKVIDPPCTEWKIELYIGHLSPRSPTRIMEK